MTLKRFVCGPFEENTYVAHDGQEAVLIDPGCFNAAERQKILSYLQAHKLTVTQILLTHGHIDHILDLKYFCDHFKLGYAMHVYDLMLIQTADRTARMYGMRIDPPEEPTRLLTEADTITFGETTWTIRHTPGHSPGSVVFYDAAHQLVMSGDVLFAGSIGRTDLWEGSYEDLEASIQHQLYTLPDETVVWSGHGRETTIGTEKQTNPFIRSVS